MTKHYQCNQCTLTLASIHNLGFCHPDVSNWHGTYDFEAGRPKIEAGHNATLCPFSYNTVNLDSGGQQKPHFINIKERYSHSSFSIGESMSESGCGARYFVAQFTYISLVAGSDAETIVWHVKCCSLIGIWVCQHQSTSTSWWKNIKY